MSMLSFSSRAMKSEVNVTCRGQHVRLFEHRNRAGALLHKNPEDLPQMFRTNAFAPTIRLLVAESVLMLAEGGRN